MEAKRIIAEDEDYDDEGNLRDDFVVDEVEGEEDGTSADEEEEDTYGDEPADEGGDDDED